MRKKLRKVNRKLMQILPKELKFKLIRHLVKIPNEISSNYVFKIAETKEEFEEAYRILHDSYVHSGFMKPDPSGLRVLKHFLLPTTQTIVVKFRERVIGTMSIIRRTKIGLPLEESFSIEDYIKDGEPCAEVSSLAIDKNHLGERGLVFLPICKYFNEFITEYMGINKIFITVNPAMADYYECLLLFKELKMIKTQNYDFANGAPAVGFWYDLSLAPSQYEKIYGSKNSEKNLFWYFFKMNCSNFIFPNRKFYKSIYSMMNKEMIDYFFNQRTSLLDSLKDEELVYISQMYPSEIENDLLFKVYNDSNITKLNTVNKRIVRSITSNTCKVFSLSKKKEATAYLLDVSEGGLKIGTKKEMFSLKTGDSLEISFFIDKNQEVKIHGVVRWLNSKNFSFGVELVDVLDKSWFDYINYLNMDFDLNSKSKAIKPSLNLQRKFKVG